MTVRPGIILCIPGPWADRRELVLAIAKLDAGYLFAGQVLVQSGSDRAWTLEFEARDERMQKAFEFGGLGRIPADDLAAVAAHESVAYLISDEVGIKAADAIQRAAVTLLRAGGVGVKCELSGAAFGKARWIELAEHPSRTSLYLSYIFLVSGDGALFTCGMRTFDLPDVAVADEIDVQDAWELMGEFNIYNLLEAPTLNSGETFSLSPESPFYRLRHATYDWYAPDDYFHNPNGVWWLDPVWKE